MIDTIAKGLLTRTLQRLARAPAGPATSSLGILKPDRLGDLVLATGAIRRLSVGLPAEQVTLIVSRATGEFARTQFPNSHIVVLPEVRSGGLNDTLKALFPLRRALLGHSFKDLVCLRYQRNLFDWIAFDAFPANSKTTLEDGADFLAAPQKRALRKPQARYVPEPVEVDPQLCRELLRHAAVCSASQGSGCTPRDILPKIMVRPTNDLGGLVVSPFSSQGVKDIRTYPPLLLAQALRTWSSRSSERIILCGSRSDASKLAELHRFCSGLAASAWRWACSTRSNYFVIASRSRDWCSRWIPQPPT